SVGNVRQEPFGDIWYGSDILIALRDPDRLSGRCGRCEYRRACGGCRARAYGEVGDILAEDPCCPYEPGEVKHG
ncbi:MAG: SPASM domain-containing protein, partial [Methanoculleus sp.]